MKKIQKLNIICFIFFYLIIFFAGCTGTIDKKTGPTPSPPGNRVIIPFLNPKKSPVESKDDKAFSETLQLLKSIMDNDTKRASRLITNNPDIINGSGYFQYKQELKNGFIDYKCKSSTPLIAAIITKNNKIAELLIEKGANIQKPGEVEYSSSIDGTVSGSGPEIWSPLFTAVQTGNVEMAKILLENGANKNLRGNVGRTLLHIAVNRNNIGMVKILIENGLNVNACDSYGSTPLASAVMGNREIAMVLKNNGAKGLERLSSEEAKKVLEAIGKDDSEKVSDIIKNTPKLINLRGFLDLTIQDGEITRQYKSRNATPLLAASIEGKTNIVKLLLENGAKINMRSQVSYSRKSKKGNENYSSFDWTPLIGAVSGGKTETAKLLIEHKANIDATNSRGMNPLMYAIKDENKEMTELLLTSGADYNARDASGNSVTEYARRTGNYEIEDLVRKYTRKK